VPPEEIDVEVALLVVEAAVGALEPPVGGLVVNPYVIPSPDIEPDVEDSPMGHFESKNR